jgi:hypothetical protein
MIQRTLSRSVYLCGTLTGVTVRFCRVQQVSANGRLCVLYRADGLAEEVAMALYGRDDLAWDELARAGLEFLLERARLEKLTSYTELNATLIRRTGLPGFDFSRADERAAMGHLLYVIVELNRPETGLMISALVSYLDANDAGSGFYGYAQDLGMLQRNASVGHAKAGVLVRTGPGTT